MSKKPIDIMLAVRRLAMLAVVKDTDEFRYREIMRWYSETFHTSLERVEELPIEHVVQHYYEVAYRDMTPEEREEEIKLLVENEEERLQRLKKEEDAVVADENFKSEVSLDKSLLEQINKAASKAFDLADALKANPLPINPAEERPIMPLGEAPESQLPKGIDMNFDDDLVIEDDWDVLGVPKDKDK